MIWIIVILLVIILVLWAYIKNGSEGYYSPPRSPVFQGPSTFSGADLNIIILIINLLGGPFLAMVFIFLAVGLVLYIAQELFLLILAVVDLFWPWIVGFLVVCIIIELVIIYFQRNPPSPPQPPKEQHQTYQGWY